MVAPPFQASVSALQDRRLLAAEQEPVDQPALIAAGDQKALQPADPLDQRLPARLAAQPVAGGAEIDRADAVPLEQRHGLGRHRVRLGRGGGDHAHRRRHQIAQLGQDRRAGPQGAAQEHQPAGLGRACRTGHPAQRPVAVVFGTAGRTAPAGAGRSPGRSPARPWSPCSISALARRPRVISTATSLPLAWS